MIVGISLKYRRKTDTTSWISTRIAFTGQPIKTYYRLRVQIER